MSKLRSYRKQSSIGQIVFPARIVGYLATSLIIISYCYAINSIRVEQIVYICCTLIWPYIAIYVYKKRRMNRKQEHINLLIDSLLIGISVVMVDFNFLPALILFVSVTMNNLMVNGVSQMIYSILVSASGILIYIGVFGYTTNNEDYPSANLITLLSYFTFAIAYSNMVFKFSQKISNNKKKYLQQKKAIELQNVSIRQKNHELIEGINYARTIKKAFMPDPEEFKQIFPESVILNESKLQVGGAFYWFHKSESKIHIALGKSIKTGVPGSMMNLISMNIVINMFRKAKHRSEFIPTFLSGLNQIIQGSNLVEEELEFLFAELDMKTNKIWVTGANSYFGIKNSGTENIENIKISPNKLLNPSKLKTELNEIEIKLNSNDLICLSVGCKIQDSSNFLSAKEIHLDIVDKYGDDCIMTAFEYQAP